MLKSREKTIHREIKDLEQYLNVSKNLEDDLIITEDARMSGTCEWFSAKDSYQKWNAFAEGPSVLWVSGKPAAGKSWQAIPFVNYKNQVPTAATFSSSTATNPTLG